MPTSLSKIILYGLAALLGLFLIWATKFTREEDRRDLKEYREEFHADPAKRMIEDLVDIRSKYLPSTPIVFGFGLLLVIFGISMLFQLAFGTPEQ